MIATLRSASAVGGALLVATLLARGSPAAAQGTTRLTVEQAVDRALEEGLEVAEANLSVDAAEEARRSARALYGPRLMVDAQAFYFNERPQLELDLGGDADLPLWLAQAIGQILPSGPMDAGDQYSVEMRVTVAQPLTKLEAIRELNEIKRLDVDLAKVGVQRTRADLAFQVREAYFGVLTVRDTIAMLAETEQEVLAREEQVKAFREAGLAETTDVLEVGVKLAEVRQAAIKARAYEAVAVSRLRTLVRLDPAVQLELVEPPAPTGVPAFEEAVSSALGHRPELQEVRLRVEQAETGVRAKLQEFVPDVTLVASYNYQSGTSFEQPELAVGATLSWTPWAWGETYYAVREARANERRARLASERVEELIRLDVERAYAEMEAARQGVAAGDAAVQQAEELYRVERARFDVNANTATDLLAAQTSLLRARTTQRAAHYDYLTAVAALRRAIGEP